MRTFVISCVVGVIVALAAGCRKDSKPAEHAKATQEVDADGKTEGPQKEIAVDLGGGVKLQMVLIPAGGFLMGSKDGYADENPVHRVRITKPFYLGKYEVTREQWQALMGRNPSDFRGPREPKEPVEMVSWDDCQMFLERLNQKPGAGAGKFRLPTEAEWEYACRAGSTSKYCFGDDEEQLGEHAWYDRNSGNRTHPVGQKNPNAWGLYDMHGNVWEWCADWYDSGYYAKSSPDDPVCLSSASLRVLRGGSRGDSVRGARSAGRSGVRPGYRILSYGFRAASTY